MRHLIPLMISAATVTLVSAIILAGGSRQMADAGDLGQSPDGDKNTASSAMAVFALG